MRRLLECEPGPEDPVSTIAAYLALREEARAVLPVLKAAAIQAAGDEGVKAVIGRRFALYPQPERADAEWAMWWADYIEALEGVAWPALEAAMAAYVADPASEFMPKPGRLLELSRTTPNKALRSYERALRATSCAPTAGALPAPMPRSEPSEEEKAQVRRMLAGFSANFAAKTMDAPTKPNLPSIAGKPDERGITPAMRDLLARQHGGQA